MVAIEELAGVDVLCADKTGTLTQNKLTLGDPFSVNNISSEQVILNAALASRAENNDTIDFAVLGGLKNKEALKELSDYSIFNHLILCINAQKQLLKQQMEKHLK